MATVLHGHHGVRPDPFLPSCFPSGQPQHVLADGPAPSQGQDFAPPLAELHEVLVSPFIQLVETILPLRLANEV